MSLVYIFFALSFSKNVKALTILTHDQVVVGTSLHTFVGVCQIWASHLQGILTRHYPFKVIGGNYGAGELPPQDGG